MKTYQVQIARTETVVYYLDVVADDEDMAEKIAYERYEDNDYDELDTVWSEEFTHNVEEVTNENNE